MNKDQRQYVIQTLALFKSIVNSGESNSAISNVRYNKSIEILSNENPKSSGDFRDDDNRESQQEYFGK